MTNSIAARRTWREHIHGLRSFAASLLRKSFYAIWLIRYDITRIHYQDQSDLHSLSGVALAFSAEVASGHAGILYDCGMGRVELTHFGGGPPICERNINMFFVWVPLLVELEQERLIRGFCRLIDSQSRLDIPYRFGYSEGASFDVRNGNVYFLPDAECEGLTCSTFVMLVCLQAGVRLLDCATWKVDPEDQRFVEQFIENRIRPRRPDLLPEFQKDLGKVRYRPDDVVSAALFRNMPVMFDEVRMVGPLLRGSTYEYYRRTKLAWQAA